jgi:hypothetical protein
MGIDLLPDEEKHLEESERCTACGHLWVFHNHHCCEFCTIDDCKCEWGRMPDEVEK